MGCVILTRKLFNLAIRVSPLLCCLFVFVVVVFFLFIYLFFNAEKWCGQSHTGRSGSDAPESFMCFIERETQNFIVKFREIFPWREKVHMARGMKSDEKMFLCQIYAIF